MLSFCLTSTETEGKTFRGTGESSVPQSHCIWRSAVVQWCLENLIRHCSYVHENQRPAINLVGSGFIFNELKTNIRKPVLPWPGYGHVLFKYVVRNWLLQCVFKQRKDLKKQGPKRHWVQEGGDWGTGTTRWVVWIAIRFWAHLTVKSS